MAAEMEELRQRLHSAGCTLIGGSFGSTWFVSDKPGSVCATIRKPA